MEEKEVKKLIKEMLTDLKKEIMGEIQSHFDAIKTWQEKAKTTINAIRERLK